MTEKNQQQKAERQGDELKPGMAPWEARHLAELEALCESPIEVALGMALLKGVDGMVALWLNDLDFDRYAQFTRPGDTGSPAVALIPQADVWASGRRYRLDFLLLAFDSKRSVSMVAIECDGHEFHDRTKEQASADRARDRALQVEGLRVARFTGADIHASPEACARSVWELAGILPKPVARPAGEKPVRTLRDEAGA